MTAVVLLLHLKRWFLQLQTKIRKEGFSVRAAGACEEQRLWRWGVFTDRTSPRVRRLLEWGGGVRVRGANFHVAFVWRACEQLYADERRMGPRLTHCAPKASPCTRAWAHTHTHRGRIEAVTPAACSRGGGLGG